MAADASDRQPVPFRHEPQLSFWRMAAAGGAMAALASLANGVIGLVAFQIWAAGQGNQPMTMIEVGVGLSALLVFPAVQLAFLAVILPALTRAIPALPRRQVPSLAMAALPTLATGALWFDPSPLFWVLTLPATLAALGGALAWLILIRRGFADRQE